MSGAALLALIVVGLGVMAGMTRRRWDAARRARVHQRALETMGRLAAQQSPAHGDPTASDGRGVQAHVRVVPGEPTEPPRPPRLRSRSHRWPAAYERVQPEPEEIRYEDAPVELELPAVTIISSSPTNPEATQPVEPIPPPALDARLLESRPHATPLAAPPHIRPAPHLPLPPREPVVAWESDLTQEPEPTAAFPAASRPTLLFDDGVGAGPRRPPTRREAGITSRRRRPVSLRRSRRPLRLSQGNHVPRRRTAIATGAVLVLAAGVALGIALTGSHHAQPPVSSPPTTVGPHEAAPTTVPTTVAPASAGPVLVTSTSGYSEYRTSGPATIVLAGTGRCWVEIRQSSPNGQVLYQGILLAGETRTLDGSVWVRLGNPTAVSLTVNGKPIAPPTLVPGEPYNLQFD